MAPFCALRWLTCHVDGRGEWAGASGSIRDGAKKAGEARLEVPIDVRAELRLLGLVEAERALRALEAAREIDLEHVLTTRRRRPPRCEGARMGVGAGRGGLRQDAGGG